MGKKLNTDLHYFVKGGFWLYLSNIFSVLRTLGIATILARVLSQDQFGAYFYILSIFSFTNVFGLPGMGSAILQSTARGFEGSFKYLNKKVFLWSMLGAVFLLTFSLYQKFFKGGEYWSIFFILALIFPFYSASTNFIYYLTGKRQFKLRTVMEAIVNVTCFLTVALALLLRRDVSFIIIAAILPQTILYIFFNIYLIKKANKLVDKEAEDYGKKLSCTYIIPTIKTQADKILITNFLGYSSNAVYNIAASASDQVYAFSKIISTLLMPKTAKLSYAEIKNNFKNKILFIFLGFILLSAGVFIIAPFAVKVLFGEKYLSSVGYLRLIVVFIPVRCLSQIIKSIHESRKNMKVLSISSNHVSIFEFILMFIGIYFFHAWGVIIAKIISDVVNLVLQIFHIYNKKMDELPAIH